MLTSYVMNILYLKGKATATNLSTASGMITSISELLKRSTLRACNVISELLKSSTLRACNVIIELLKRSTLRACNLEGNLIKRGLHFKRGIVKL